MRLKQLFKNKNGLISPSVLILVALLMIFYFINYQQGMFQRGSSTQSKPISASPQHMTNSNWSQTSFEGWYPLPIKESVIDHQDELSYFVEWTKVIEEGINNRYNIVSVLNSKRAENDYWESFASYQSKQKDFITKLQRLDAPERLKNFHNQVVDASLYQINLYEKWAEQKSSNPNAKLNDLINDVNLKRCNELLWAAYYEFQRLYPNRDKATNDAIEMRLCQFDII